MVKGENAICPTTLPPTSATSDRVRALAARNALMMYCSVWLLTSNVLNASTVTSVMVLISSFVSFLIMIVGFIRFSFIFWLTNKVRFYLNFFMYLANTQPSLVCDSLSKYSICDHLLPFILTLTICPR